jgi:hypothetical protein
VKAPRALAIVVVHGEPAEQLFLLLVVVLLVGGLRSLEEQIGEARAQIAPAEGSSISAVSSAWLAAPKVASRLDPTASARAQISSAEARSKASKAPWARRRSSEASARAARAFTSSTSARCTCASTRRSSSRLVFSVTAP